MGQRVEMTAAQWNTASVLIDRADVMIGEEVVRIESHAGGSVTVSILFYDVVQECYEIDVDGKR